eukprot:SM000107S14073  [mRNA]  locus=s107:395748:397164:+ [translate_table: standard]
MSTACISAGLALSRRHSPAQLVCGVLAGGVAGALVNPLEVLRARAVASAGGGSAAEVLGTLLKRGQQGRVASVDLRVGIARAALSKGAQFVTYEAVRRRAERGLGANPRILPLPHDAEVSSLAGAAAGIVSTLASYTFEVLLDKTALAKDKYGGIGKAVKRVLREEGVPGLYRGITPALAGVVPGAAASFLAYDTLVSAWRRQLHREDIGTMRTLAAGAGAGAMSSALVYPLEVARKRLSFSGLPACAAGDVAARSSYRTLGGALRGVVREEGVRGLYRGLSAQMLQASRPYCAPLSTSVAT